MAYDITEAFEDIELALIKSMRANMKRHINDEYDEGMNWTQWQAEMLAGLSQYRAENQDVLKGYMGKMNSELAGAIRDAYATGESELEIELLKQIQKGYTPPKNGKKVNMQGAFFRNNQRKLNALVKATTDDMKKAETALLRMNDDIYRQTIFKAQMFYNTGAGSMWKCVDMATKDFLAAGYNCVEYKNGARVNIASYAEMSLRTSNKRANLMGQANFREKHGMHLVKVNARGTACPLCLPYLGKVYVDDVYGAGTEKESKETGYPLLSTAVDGGLFHPNCKDACSTYYEGINQPQAEVTDEQAKEINRRYNLEQTQRYYERNYRKNVRLANGSLTEENVKKYSARASAYKKKLTDLCNANSDVLRLDKQRLSLHGVLSVDKNGRLSITPKSNKNANISHTEAYNDILNRMKIDDYKIEYREVGLLKKSLTDDEIVKKLGGGDMTDGSCASLALAYTGNRCGFDVTDFRGGQSCEFFQNGSNIESIMNFNGAKGQIYKVKKQAFDTAKIIKDLPKDKEYLLSVAKHASIIKNTENGVMYLELQSSKENGWTYFANDKYTTSETLIKRFGARKTEDRMRLGGKTIIHEKKVVILEIDSLKDNEEFRDILGYINTATDKQKKGASGFEK